jgi:uncharacterized protein (UPF0248 family)
MTYQIFDNVLPEEDFQNIKNSMLNPNFPWNYTPVVSNKKENLPISASYYFTHQFWSGFQTEPESHVFAPILNQIECHAVMRIKGNLYPSTETIVHHMDHIDYEFPHRGAIFYINTNNGLTVIDGKEVESIENRLLLFDPTIPHHSTTCTNDKCRVNVNFNFF